MLVNERCCVTRSWALDAPPNHRTHRRMERASLALLLLMSCGKPNPVPPPTIWYNDLLVQAGIQGSVRFQVRLDSTGSPQLPTFAILAAPNPGFAVGIRKGLEHWRDPGMAGHTLEQTVRFVLLVDTSPPDSIAQCRTASSEWVVCRRRAPARPPVY